MNGHVWLVGAGPGDPDLLTRKAARVLAQADLVLYDALVSPEMLKLAPRAQRFCVGKRARGTAFPQQTIHRLMTRAAGRGKRVVRLKCGDPFVLGRGGEEALALAAAGVPFDVVPGLTAAIAAPALAGIPVTHRGLASAFLVLSGHTESAYRPILESLPANALTLVVMMGLATRDRLSRLLLERGWAGRTPAALLFSASLPDSYVWTGTLDGLATAALPEGLETAAGTLVIGEVVSIAAAAAQAVPDQSVVAVDRIQAGGRHASSG